MVEAKSLIGGMIYLHEKKSMLPTIGGRIYDAKWSLSFDKFHVFRIKFFFESITEAKKQRWRGANHDMAWTGGIIDVDD